MKAKIMVGFTAMAGMALMLAGSVTTASADTACHDVRNIRRDRAEIRYDVRNIRHDRVEIRRDQRQIGRLDHRCER